MTLDEFRKQNPAYTDKSTWPDNKLALGLYNKYYKDKMSIDEFNQRIGYSSSSNPEIAQTKDEIIQSDYEDYEDRQATQGYDVNPVQDRIERLSPISKTKWEQDRTLAQIKEGSGDEGLSEAWVNPVDAIVGPLAMPIRVAAGKLTGKVVSKTAAKLNLQGTANKVAEWLTSKLVSQAPQQGAKSVATQVGASLAAEPVVGTGLEYGAEALTESDVPLALQIPIGLAAAITAGTVGETALIKLSDQVGSALTRAGKEVTPKAVHDALKAAKVVDTGSPDIISKKVTNVPSETSFSEKVRRESAPLDMKEEVKRITKMKAERGEDMPELTPEAPTRRRTSTDTEPPTKPLHTTPFAEPTVAKANTGQTLMGGGLGLGAGVETDEEGNISGYNIKKGVGGGAMGAMLMGTRLPRVRALKIKDGEGKLYTAKKAKGTPGKIRQLIRQDKRTAKKMKDEGAGEAEIFKATGMWQAEDGRWRWELDDSPAHFDFNKFPKIGSTELQDIMDHPRLFEIYPQLKTLKVFPGHRGGGKYVRGSDPIDDLGHISIDPRAKHATPEEIMIHEVQHAVQFIEGHARGGNRDYLMHLDAQLAGEVKARKERLATFGKGTPEYKAEKKEVKTIERKLKHLGLAEQREAVEAIEGQMDKAATKLANLEFAFLMKKPGSNEAKALKAQIESLNKEVGAKQQELRKARSDYVYKAHDQYENIAGEREANATMARLAMTAEMRKEAYPDFKDSVLMSNFIDSHVSATTGAIGAVYGGVDWDEFESTGRIVVDPDRAMRGLLLGVAGGTAIKGAPRAMEAWTTVTRDKVIKPILDIANGAITNETMRYQMGLNRSAEVREIIKTYKRDANLVLRKAIHLGRELNEIAPSRLAQKRLAQILEGGVTTNASLAKKAHKINAMFKDLKDATRDMNLNRYSQFEELTRRQRAELRNIIKDKDTPLAEALTAKEMLNNHYHVGSAKEYLPIFNPRFEGLTKADARAVRSEIRTLKHKSRFMNPEGDPSIEAQITELESFLKTETKFKRGTKGGDITRSYSKMRSDMPAETLQVFNDIIGTSYRVAKGAATQGKEVLKMDLLRYLSKNSDWVHPVGTGIKPPKNFEKVLGDGWGELNGKYVRKDVLSDLQEIIDYRTGLEKNMDQLMGYWKYGKAILNPVTHARNFASNVTQAYFAGVHPTDVHTYSQAAKALTQGRENVRYKEAEDWGLYNNTFIESDISTLRDELSDLRAPKHLADWIQKAVSAPAVLYDQSERLFKTAVFIQAREQGKTIDEAAKHAEKYLFDYQDIPPMVKHYKRWAVPFATYTYKAIPMIAETAITKPWKPAAVFASMYGMTTLAQNKLGLTDDEVAADKSAMFDGGIGQILLPFPDTYGNRQYFNLGAYMPWSGMGQTWGQSALPFGDILPSNPLFGLASAVMTNRDAFTGQEIYDEALDSVAEVTGKYLEYAWKQMMPSLVPGGYGMNKLVDGLRNELGGNKLDYAGRPITLSESALRALLGVQLTPANQELFEKFTVQKVNKIQRAVSREKSNIQRRYERNEITHDEALDKLQKLQELQTEKLTDKMKYVK